MGKIIDITGERFGHLTVLERVENSKFNSVQYLCLCDCGNITISNSNALRTGHKKSCGCTRKINTRKWLLEYNTKHNGAKTRLYVVWVGMKQRVENPNNQRYKDYGGRGIAICDEWHDFAQFQKWAYENGYDDKAAYGKCTLDRIDVNGDYEPSNCRWVDLKVQANNKRKEQTPCRTDI